MLSLLKTVGVYGLVGFLMAFSGLAAVIGVTHRIFARSTAQTVSVGHTQTQGRKMNKAQRGSGLVIALVFLGIIVALVGLVAASYISAYNTGNRMEQAIKATHENNKNVLSQYGQKVLEAAQVPEMMRDDLIAVVKAAVEGRYGEKGSQATFQWIQEQNPTVDPGLYQKVQQIIESGRTEFQNSQTRLIDQKRAYETALGSFWQGMWMGIAGYPKIDLEVYKIVTTGRAESAFESGREDAPLKLR